MDLIDLVGQVDQVDLGPVWTVSPGDPVELIAQMDQICKGIGGPDGPVAQQENKNNMCSNTIYSKYYTIMRCSLEYASSSWGLDCLLPGIFHVCSAILQPASTTDSVTPFTIAIGDPVYANKCCYLSMPRPYSH